MKRTLTTLIVWGVFVGALIILARASPVLLGGLTGLGVTFMLVIVITRMTDLATAKKLWRLLFVMPIAAGAIGFAVGGVQVAAGAVVGALVVPALVGLVAVRRRGETGAIEKFDAWCATAPEAAAIEARVKPFTVPAAYEAVRILEAHDRLGEAEAVLLAIALEPAWQLERAALLVELRIAQGNALGARAAVEEVRVLPLAAGVTEMPALLDARIRIADGKGKKVARELAGSPGAAMTPAVREIRALVHADACVAIGDRDAAKKLVAEVARVKPQLIAKLARAKRPLAPIAAELAAELAADAMTAVR